MGYMILLSLFALLHLVEWQGRLGRWAACYGDDLVCLPLILGGVLVLHRVLGRLGPSPLGWSHALCGWGLFMVYFEGILPRLNTRATADPWDLVAYTAGLIVFQVMINRPLSPPAWVAALRGPCIMDTAIQRFPEPWKGSVVPPKLFLAPSGQNFMKNRKVF